jgi:uncharacterized membrane protein
VRPYTLDDFLSAAERTRVKRAIGEVEATTSAEIRVHLDEHNVDDELDRAAFIFRELDMHRTRERNGVLLYVNVADRRLAVIGDAGIHTHVGQDFWNDVVELVRMHFIGGRHADGIVAGIERIGEKLRAHFPGRKDDSNELSDEISMHR